MARPAAKAESPTVRTATEQIRRLDPLLVEAADDVDLELLRWFQSLSPLERLRACSRATSTLGRFRRGAPSGS